MMQILVRLKEKRSRANELGKKMGSDILSLLGQEQINQLDNLANDFDYTP